MIMRDRVAHPRVRERTNKGRRGFSLLELAVVLTITIVLAGFAVGNYVTARRSSRIAGSYGDIASLVTEAKLRAAAGFTHARVYANLSGNTFHLELWNKSGNSGAGCWQTDGDTVNSCTASSSPVQKFPSGVSFGYGNLASPPSNTEGTLGQAPLCYTGYGGESGNTTTVANTACVEFNSRGMPSDPSNSGTADAAGALYVTDGVSVEGVTVLATGFIQSWYAPDSASATWKER